MRSLRLHCLYKDAGVNPGCFQSSERQSEPQGDLPSHPLNIKETKESIKLEPDLQLILLHLLGETLLYGQLSLQLGQPPARDHLPNLLVLLPSLRSKVQVQGPGQGARVKVRAWFRRLGTGCNVKVRAWF